MRDSKEAAVDLDYLGPARVAVVDDDESLRDLVALWLEPEGYALDMYADGADLLEALAGGVPDLVLLDLHMPRTGGIEVLRHVAACLPELPVIVLTVDDRASAVIGAMELGAFDYIAKPLERSRLLQVVRRALAPRAHSAGGRLDGDGAAHPLIVGGSRAMRELFGQIARLRGSDVSVLVHGESGSGKELVARAVAAASARRDGPFVALNCAAIPETLQESELFGHERGAFTGAHAQRPGVFERAHRGTLFLDEIGELSAAAQSKLLRVLQERTFVRVGGRDEIHSDFRLVAATHRDLSGEVAARRFREDLFFRVAVVELEVPPLRDRQGDVPLLVEHLLGRWSRESGRRVPVVTREALAVLGSYRWPGNVRELDNVLQRAAVLAHDERISVRDLPARLLRSSAVERVARPRPAQPTVATLEAIERQAIEASLAEHDGNVSAACRALGIGRTTLYRRLRKYGLR